MDFDQLKNVWKKAERFETSDSDKELNRKLEAVTSTQHKIKKYFKFEMIIALAAIIFFVTGAYFRGDIEPYFYKLFTLILIGSVPLNIRLFLSMKVILGIDYTHQLRENLIVAKNHLKITTRVYYIVIVFTIVSLVIMSWWDDYFLQLPSEWQVGIMGYFLLVFIFSIYLVNKLYGSRLREIGELLDEF